MRKAMALLAIPILAAGGMFLAKPQKAEADPVRGFVGGSAGFLAPSNDATKQIYGAMFDLNGEFGISRNFGRSAVKISYATKAGNPITIGDVTSASSRISELDIGGEALFFLSKNPRLYVGVEGGYKSLSEEVAASAGGQTESGSASIGTFYITPTVGIEAKVSDNLNLFAQAGYQYAPYSGSTSGAAGNTFNMGGIEFNAGIRYDF